MSLRPESRDDAVGVVPKKTFATERINPGGVLEKTVIFVRSIGAHIWNCCCLKWNLSLTHFFVASSSKIGSRLVFGVKKFCTVLNEIDQSFYPSNRLLLFA